MKNSKLLDAVGGIRPDYIALAEKDEKAKKQYSWKTLVPIAACLCLVFVAILTFPNIFGGNSSGGSGAGEHLSTDGSSAFMSYKGPVLPLLLSPGEAQENLTATRRLTYDFYMLKETPEGEKPNLSSVLIKDEYKIENTGKKKTITLLYPFVSSVDELFFTAPRILRDGKVIESQLYYGDFTGSFSAADGSENASETLNMENFRDWEDFQKLLSKTDYLEKAQTTQQDLSQILVTVYELKESYYPENAEGLENPSLVAGLAIDKNKTRVLSLGFNSRFSNQKESQEYFMYSMPKKQEASTTDDHHYLILIGEDTKSLSLEAQKSGGWNAYEKGNTDKRNDLKDAGAKIKRMDMSLEEALDLALPHLYERYKKNVMEMVSDSKSTQQGGWEETDKSYISYHDFKEFYKRDLSQFGVFSQQPMMRYEDGALENSDVRTAQRVFFAEFKLDLEAAQELDLTIESYKKGSLDFHGKKHNDKVYGYDLLNNLNSALIMKTTLAEIKDYGKVDIVRQNFGFDLEKDIKSVELPKNIPHYYMEVKAK